MSKVESDCAQPYSAALIPASVIEKMAAIYGGMPFLAAIPDSPAARAGLRWGDVVVSVNGLPTPDAQAFIKARMTRESAAVVRFVRMGTEHEVELCW